METRRRGGPGEDRALDAYVRLLRAAGCVAARAHRHLARVDLTPSQFGALQALHRLGPLCQRDIALKVLRTEGNVTQVLRNLERRGLIERRRDAANRRFRTAQLTPRGRRLMAAVLPRHVRAVAAEMDGLAPRELKSLASLCRRLEKPAE
jgi:MarR family 2-MHQ and catechol resistance regulon transcriptional repressor